MECLGPNGVGWRCGFVARFKGFYREGLLDPAQWENLSILMLIAGRVEVVVHYCGGAFVFGFSRFLGCGETLKATAATAEADGDLQLFQVVHLTIICLALNKPEPVKSPLNVSSLSFTLVCIITAQFSLHRQWIFLFKQISNLHLPVFTELRLK